ncbi:extracellular solute-binding protein, family 3 [Rhodospirillum rubrum ATCC 11170]|uniref:Extracellular solute-binding protein, family 3 n=2 Tax=Rhodospirillum rubrum TaxID=1085 RepID=Q2RUU9_RHORT|nr:extracellular solute-binding protein, family 3 [Rhodospirillum rubrum ATCC 11170]MBK5953686.1 amino acid ABC transporter [Rhodospirillum rubrum]HAQ00350.1 amino acid ABC transporter [Rhodospirillum rubrum]HCF16595.1 amino acid ABC transporter [Rhodospirillum rubrum]
MALQEKPEISEMAMMTTKASWKAMVAGAAALMTMVAASLPANADTLEDIKKAGVIKAATEMQFPPFDFLEGDKYVGVDRDLMDEVAKELGVKVEYIDLPWTSVLPGLEAGKFDLVIAPVTITKERLARYAFTLPISEGTAALMKRADDDSITKPEDIAGKTIGGGKGTSQLGQIKEYAAALPGKVEFKEYVDSNQSYADLAAGRVDASVNSYPNLAYAAAQRPETFAVVLPPFGKTTYFSWVSRLGEKDASLVEAVNAALLKLGEDGRMSAIHEKWFGKGVDLPKTIPEPSF